MSALDTKTHRAVTEAITKEIARLWADENSLPGHETIATAAIAAYEASALSTQPDVETLQAQVETLRAASEGLVRLCVGSNIFAVGAQGRLSEAIEAARTALNSVPAPRVTLGVRKLKWSEPHRSIKFPDYHASVPLLRLYYSIKTGGALEDGRFAVYVDLGAGSHWVIGRDTLEEAKAAAQADYEARIMSALVLPAPKPEGEA
jgi:hypothetical protein